MTDIYTMPIEKVWELLATTDGWSSLLINADDDDVVVMTDMLKWAARAHDVVVSSWCDEGGMWWAHWEDCEYQSVDRSEAEARALLHALVASKVLTLPKETP